MDIVEVAEAEEDDDEEQSDASTDTDQDSDSGSGEEVENNFCIHQIKCTTMDVCEEVEPGIKIENARLVEEFAKVKQDRDSIELFNEVIIMIITVFFKSIDLLI